MKKLVAAFVAFAALTGSASAADLAARPYIKAPAPVMAPVYNWTGFYLFGGGGYGLWEADTTTTDPVTGACALCTEQRQGGKGYFGTVGGGFDWQFGGSWVAGVFGDAQFGSIRGTIQDQNPFFAGREKLETTWAAGVRVGYLVAPNVLSYVNGGYTGSRWSGTTMADTFTGIATPFVTPSFNRDGWFLGGGVENSLNFFGWNAPGWFMKTEYRVAEYERTSLTDRVPGGGAIITVPGVAGSFVNPQNNITFRPIVQTISTSIVYRFNWGGAPLVAKY
jgi:outer membrane immunogenic protein